MSTELGTAYVTIAPSTKGFVKQLAATAGQGGTAAGTTAGNQFNASLGSVIKGSAVFSVVQGAMQKVGSVISSSLDSAISRADTLTMFPTVMKNLGYSGDEAAASINKLADGVNGLPTKLDTVANLTQSIAPVSKSLTEATDVALSFSNALLASSKSTADQDRAMQQFTKALSKGKFEMEDWQTLQEVMPGQLSQIAKHMLGAKASTGDLYNALKSGKVSMQKFKDTLVDMNKTDYSAEGFTNFAQQAKQNSNTIEASINRMKNRVSISMANMLQALNNSGLLVSVFNGINDAIDAAGKAVMRFGEGFASSFDFSAFQEALQGLGDAFFAPFQQGEDAATSFGSALGDLSNVAAGVVSALTPIFGALGNVIKFLADNIKALVPVIKSLVVGFLTLKTIKSVIGTVTSLKNSFKSLFKTMAKHPLLTLLSAITVLVSGLIYFFTQTEEGKRIWNAFMNVLKENPAAAIATISTIGVSVSILIKSFGKIKSAASTAFSTISGKLNPLKNIFSKLGGGGKEAADGTKALGDATEETGRKAGKSTGQLFGTAAVIASIGASIWMASTGFAILANSLTAIAEQGGNGIAVLSIAGATLVGLTAILATLTPTAAAAAVPMLALGAGIAIMSLGLSVLVMSLTQLASTGAVGIALLATAGIILAGLVITFGILAPVLAAAAVPILLVGAGIGILAAGVGVLAFGLAAIITAFTSLVEQLPIVCEYGLQASVNFLALAGSTLAFGAGAAIAGAGAIILGAGLIIMGAGLLLCAATLPIVAATSLIAGAGFALMGTGLMVCAPLTLAMGAGLLIMSAGLALVGPMALIAAAGIGVFALAAAAASLALIPCCWIYENFGNAMKNAGDGATALNASFGGIAASVVTLAFTLGSMQGCVDSFAEQIGGLKGKIEDINGAFAEFAGSSATTAGAFAVLSSAILITGEGVAMLGAGLTQVAASITLSLTQFVAFGEASVTVGANIQAFLPSITTMSETLTAMLPNLMLAGQGMQAFNQVLMVAGAAIAGVLVFFLSFAEFLTKSADSGDRLNNSLTSIASSSVTAVTNLATMGDITDTCTVAMNTLGTSAEGMNKTFFLMAIGSKQMVAGFSEMLRAIKTAQVGVVQAFQAMELSFTSLKASAISTVESIREAFNNMELYIPSPKLGKMPHFRMSGSFNAETGEVPTISVDWYKKGGVFSRPQIIGVGDASSPEIVTPEDKMRGIFEDVLKERQPMQINQTINSNDPALVAAVVASKLRRAF